MNDELTNILDKVHTLYHKYGIKSITMDDVASELGISKKTLYIYVSDKADLVSRVLDRELKCREDYFNTLLDRNLNAVEEMIEVHRHINQLLLEYNRSTEYDLKKYYPEIYKTIVEVKRNRMFDWIVMNIVKGKKEGLYRNSVNENIIAKLVVSRNEFIAESDFFSVNEFTSYEFFTEVLTYHMRGIATTEGIAQYEKYIVENFNK